MKREWSIIFLHILLNILPIHTRLRTNIILVEIMPPNRKTWPSPSSIPLYLHFKLSLYYFHVYIPYIYCYDDSNAAFLHNKVIYHGKQLVQVNTICVQYALNSYIKHCDSLNNYWLLQMRIEKVIGNNNRKIQNVRMILHEQRTHQMIFYC